MQIRRWGLAASLVLAVVVGVMGWSASARTLNAPILSFASEDFFFPPYPSDNDRMGFDRTSGHDTTPLHAGWYVDWAANANPDHPGGVEYARVIPLSIHDTGTFCGGRAAPATLSSQVTAGLTGTALIQNVQASPGALWLVGNEPDSIYLGNPIQAELYAELYHYFYTTIKAADPTAKVAIGAIVQPSPLRMEYLDKALNHYQSVYHESLPTDLWNIHLYILNEGSCGDWGATVPPFSSGNNAWNIPFTPAALLDVTAMRNNLRAFRQWMHDHGYGNRPLIVTEFGVLPPNYYAGFGDSVAAQFLTDMFNMMLTATDPAVGYAADGNRLVQFWAWFSTDFEPPPGYQKYGGDLFETGGTALTPIGQAFAAQGSTHFAPYADLYPVPLGVPSISAGASGPVTVSLAVQLDNRGNTAIQSAPVRFAQYDYATRQLLASTDLTVSQVLTRYGGVQPQVRHEWLLAPAKMYTLTFEIDPARTISQTRRSDQSLAYLTWQPNLVVTAFESDHPSVFYWEQPVTATITTTIRNIGQTTSTAASLRLSASISGGGQYPDEELPVPPLPPDASADVTGTLALSSLGEYAITATLQLVRPDGSAYNGSTALNLLATAPDLTITSLVGDAAVVHYRGVPVTQTITATIHNLGVIASVSGRVDFRSSVAGEGTANLEPEGVVPPLAPGASAPVTATLVITSSGVYTVRAAVLYDHTELNTQNNTATLSLLSASDLVYLPVMLRAGPLTFEN